MSDTDRQDLHMLVDHIPAGDVPAARKILRALMDPVELSLLSAAVDDEPETDDERAAVERAQAEPGAGTTHEEVLREFGL
jgi:plasmid stabilization system protein ParE